jgi:hypothetical protein
MENRLTIAGSNPDEWTLSLMSVLMRHPKGCFPTDQKAKQTTAERKTHATGMQFQHFSFHCLFIPALQNILARFLWMPSAKRMSRAVRFVHHHAPHQ